MSAKGYAAVLLLSSGLLISPAYAGSSIETAGDIVAIAIPALAYGSTYYKDDKAGRQQFYYGFGANLAASQVLKSTIKKERPDGSDNDSFPSRHTSVAFQGASFMHKRYGFEYSIPAYIGAGFGAYSRLEADKHDATDVLAGAALGALSSFYFTKQYNDDVLIMTDLAPDYYGMSVHYQF